MGGAGSLTRGTYRQQQTGKGLQDGNNDACGRVLTEPVVQLVGVHGLWRQEVGVVVVGVVQAARVPVNQSRMLLHHGCTQPCRFFRIEHEQRQASMRGAHTCHQQPGCIDRATRRSTFWTEIVAHQPQPPAGAPPPLTTAT